MYACMCMHACIMCMCVHGCTCVSVCFCTCVFACVCVCLCCLRVYELACTDLNTFFNSLFASINCYQ